MGGCAQGVSLFLVVTSTFFCFIAADDIDEETKQRYDDMARVEQEVWRREALEIGRQKGDECGVKVILNDDGRLELFALGFDEQIHHKWQMPDTTTWSNWVALPVTNSHGDWTEVRFNSAPSVVKTPDGRIQLLALGNDGNVYHNFQHTPGGSYGSMWASLGGPMAHAVSAIVNAEGRIAVFAQGNESRALMYKRQLENSTHMFWTEWASLGGILTSVPSVTLTAESMLAVFVRGFDESLYVKRQYPTHGGTVRWGKYEGLGGDIISTPSVPSSLNPSNLLEVFTRQTDKAIWFRKEEIHTRPLSDAVEWTEWQSLGGVMSSGVSVVTNQDDCFELYGRSEKTNEILVKRQMKSEGVEYEPWESIGGNHSATSPTTVALPDGSVHVFIRGMDHQIHHNAKMWGTADEHGRRQQQWTGWNILRNDNHLESKFISFLC